MFWNMFYLLTSNTGVVIKKMFLNLTTIPIKQQFSGLINGANQRNKHKISYCYFDDMINIRIFHSNLLKIDKKSYRDIDIYYIGYMAIKKTGDCENIHSVNPLCLIIHSATGYFKEKNGEKYLIIVSTEKYEEVFSGIKSEIETLNGGKELFMKKTMLKLELILTMIYL